jgi:hypothetical protein
MKSTSKQTAQTKTVREAAEELSASGNPDIVFTDTNGNVQKLVNLKHDDYSRWLSTDKRIKTGTGVPQIFLLENFQSFAA